MRCNAKLETTVFRKETNNDIYLQWRSFAPMTWKKGTLQTLIRRAYTVCSNDNLLQEELCHIETCFTEFNGYPKWLSKQTLDSFKNNNKNHSNNINNENHNNTNLNRLSDKIVHTLKLPFTEFNSYPKWLSNQALDSFKNNNKNHSNNINNENHNDRNLNRLSDKIVHTLKLPYKGDRGINLIKSIKASTKKSLPDKHDVRIILTGTILSSHFNIKDDTNKQHKHDFVYFSRCPSTDCTDSYTGETARRLSERVMDHAGTDTKSHIVRHCLNSNPGTVTGADPDFKFDFGKALL